LTLLLGAAPAPLSAQSEAPLGAARAQQLGHYADQLLAGDEQLRRSATQVLGHLGVDFLPALLIRLTVVQSARPSHDEVVKVLNAFRRGAGPHRADDEPDLARGIEPWLERERTRNVGAVAEPLLYLRALEAMDDERADLALARFVALDQGAWDNELSLLRKRRGVRLLPALVALRSHESPAVRRFAVNQIDALGMTDPESALALADPHLLGQLIRAYVNPPDYAAMPLIVRRVNAPRIQVRDAARLAVARYGKNAIWQLREQYQEHSGQAANKAWDAERTARELYAVLDRAQLQDADTLLARGMTQLLANDLTDMQRNYDLLLTKYPQFAERSKLAPGYAALGADRLERDDLADALAAYSRALWLDPSAAQARRWQAQATFIAAELTLTLGVADLTGYDRALELDPNLRAARHARDVLSGEQGRRTRESKQAAAAGSLLLFAVLSVALLRSGRRPKQALTSPPTAA
jgi:hypothetical protein